MAKALRQISLIVCLVLARGMVSEASAESFDSALKSLIQEHHLRGSVETALPSPSVKSPLALLGRKLFFSTRLSGDLEVSCSSCHHPLLGGTDRLPLPIGTGAVDPLVLGPGREHKSGQVLVPRNAPTTFNVGAWKKALFYDGRVERILPASNGTRGGIRTPDVPYGTVDPKAGDDLVAAQARFPVVAAEEMRGRHLSGPDSEVVREAIASRLRQSDVWRGEFYEKARIQSISFSDIARALSAYQRSQVFVNTPWHRYVKGDSESITDSAKRGALIFFRSREMGGADCASCHSGDFFTDEKFHVLAVPQVGPGRYDRGLGLEDHGRYVEEPGELTRYAFRTPSLLNVEVTAPYGHSGVFPTLESVVRHHLSPEKTISNFSPSHLPQSIQVTFWRLNTVKALASLQWARTFKSTTLFDLTLSDAQVADLVSFLTSLTDSCVKSEQCLQPWIEPERGQP